MFDLIRALRNQCNRTIHDFHGDCTICFAAREIERLRNEVRDLRSQLAATEAACESWQRMANR